MRNREINFLKLLKNDTIMMLSEDASNAVYQINGYEPGCVLINHTSYKKSVLIFPQQLITDWRPQQLSDLRCEDWAQVITNRPEILLIGTGPNFHYPLSQQSLSPLYEQQIGVELMSTRAACRTYIALIAEQRPVAAALFV